MHKNQTGAASRAEMARAGLGGSVKFIYHFLGGYAISVPDARDKQAARHFRGDPSVAIYTQNKAEAASVEAVSCMNQAPTSSVQCFPEGLDRVQAEHSSATPGDGSGNFNQVRIAVIDTGVNAHEDLGVVYPPNPSDCIAGDDFHDLHGHGTKVAGVAAAKDNDRGIVGSLPGATVVSYKVFRSNEGTAEFDRILCGIDRAGATLTDSDPNNDITVANMSLAGLGWGTDDSCNADLYRWILCVAEYRGLDIVAAAGNDSVEVGTVMPASSANVLTVTAFADGDGDANVLSYPNPGGCQYSDEVCAPFSNWADPNGPDRAHTIAAPGVSIISTTRTGGYGRSSGTSLAAPYVSGLLALCIYRQICTGTPTQARSRFLQDTTLYNDTNLPFGFWGSPHYNYVGKWFGYPVRGDRH